VCECIFGLTVYYANTFILGCNSTNLTAYCTKEIEYCLVFFKINKYNVCVYSNFAHFVANKCATIFNFIRSGGENLPIRHCKPLQYYYIQSLALGFISGVLQVNYVTVTVKKPNQIFL